MEQCISDYGLQVSQYGQQNPSDYNVSLNDSKGNDPRSLDFEESDSDPEIRSYHQLLMDNYIDDEKLEEFSSSQDLRKSHIRDLSAKHGDSKSVLSVHSTTSLKSRGTRSFNTVKTVQTKYCGDGVYPDNFKDKRKYMKQEAKRIKSELKSEEMKEKQEKKENKELDLHIDGKKKKGSSKKGNRRKLTNKTLEMLCRKFDNLHASENNLEFKGPKLNLGEIGLLFDIGKSTIHKLYSEWQEDPSFSERINRENMRQRGPQRKITVERLEHIGRLIKENPFMTQNELTVELNKIQDLKFEKEGKMQDITRTTVARLLKVGKFKKKRVKCVPKERNTSKSLENRFKYCSKYRELIEQKAKVYFLDQSGFNLYMTRDKAWARPNEEITVNCPINKGKRFSLIAIIAEDGLTHWRIIEGTYRKYEYLDFIRQLFTRIREEMDEFTQQERESEENQRQKWLILDNCAIHDREQTQKLASECDINILYLPPYSPQLNPIEMWFGQLKSIIRKANYTGQNQLLTVMQRELTKFQDSDFSNYFCGILKHVERGVNKQKF